METMKDSSYNPSLSDAEHRRLEQELHRRARNVSPNDEKNVFDKLPGKLSSVMMSVNQHFPNIQDMIQTVKMLFDMIRDKNFTIEWSSKALIIGGLLYFISPIDFLPDFIPVLGYIDDAVVISFVIKAIVAEVDRYKAFLGYGRPASRTDAITQAQRL
jgi:uncharacterized membrane protein YkvA (DUF1232 family)